TVRDITGYGIQEGSITELPVHAGSTDAQVLEGDRRWRACRTRTRGELCDRGRVYQYRCSGRIAAAKGGIGDQHRMEQGIGQPIMVVNVCWIRGCASSTITEGPEVVVRPRA